MRRLAAMILLLSLALSALAQETTFSVQTAYNNLYQIGYSPDGTLLLTSSYAFQDDETFVSSLQVYDAQTGEALSVLEDDEDSPVTFAYSPDESLLVTGANDGTVSFRDATTLEALTTFPAHESVPDIQFSPDGARMVTGDSSGIMVWDAATLEPALVLTPQDMTDPVLLRTLISPDSTVVAGLYLPGIIYFWDIVNGEALLTLQPEYDVEPYTAAFVPQPDSDSIEILLAYDDLEIVDAVSGEQVALLETVAPVTAFAISPDESILATGDTAGNITLRELESRDVLLDLIEDAGFIQDIAFNPAGTRLAVAHGEGRVTVFNLE